MIYVAIQLIAAFSAHAVHGINPMTQSLPRARIGTSDVDPAPPVVALCDSVADASVFLSLEPPTVPAWMLWGFADADAPAKGAEVARDVVLMGAYMTDDAADPLTAGRVASYVMRGARRTFRRYNRQALADGYRELNGVRVLQIAKTVEHAEPAAIGRFRAWSFLEIHASVVETMA